MKDSILIKGNQYGLSIFINENSTFEQINTELISKLKSAKNFFGSSKVTLSFSGKSLQIDEQDNLIDTFNKYSDLQILCIIDESEDLINLHETISQEIREDVTKTVAKEIKEQYHVEFNQLKAEIDTLKIKNSKLNDKMMNIKEHKTKTLSLQYEDKVTFHNATLRSGQQVVVKHSVVIMGDVNNGARVEADGNVIILGKLKGVVHAGLSGINSAYVIALDMKPVQLRINNTYGRASDKMVHASSRLEPEIAFIHDDMIAIDKIDNKVLKKIRELS